MAAADAPPGERGGVRKRALVMLAVLAVLATSSAAYGAQLCTCADVYNPVCAEVSVTGGTERRTFLNECAATVCGDATVVREGECELGDEITEPSCDGVCSGEPDGGCSLTSASSTPSARSLGSAWMLGAGFVGFFAMVLRARQRARR